MNSASASALVLAGLVLALPRCGQAADVVQVERPVAPFERVVSSTSADVEVSQAADTRLVVEAEPQVHAWLTTEVRGDTLYLGSRSPATWRASKPVRFLLRLPQLRAVRMQGSGELRLAPMKAADLALTAAGSGNIRAQHLEADRVAVELAGSGDAHFQGGRARSLEVVISGAGDVHALPLRVSEARVRINGSGEAAIAATSALRAEISGSGRVTYLGQPGITQHITGAGEVVPASAPSR